MNLPENTPENTPENQPAGQPALDASELAEFLQEQADAEAEIHHRAAQRHDTLLAGAAASVIALLLIWGIAGWAEHFG